MLKRNEFWSRVFTFVPTATKDDGEEIDEKAFRTAIDYQIENGVHGVCIFGSTGGNGSFSDEEMKKATAIAAKQAMERFGLKGTLKVFGGPAEEQLVSRPYFVRDGWFDDVDVAFHNHIGAEFSSSYGLLQSALISAVFTFHGETAHAGTSPWNGRDALDGLMLMDVGMAQYREHMHPSMRVHRVITNGGDQPNVIPRTAAIWWFFRDLTAEGATRLFEQAKKIAQGAALMSNTTYDVEVQSAVWPLRCNRTLAELLQRQIETVGVPAWTQEEE